MQLLYVYVWQIPELEKLSYYLRAWNTLKKLFQKPNSKYWSTRKFQERSFHLKVSSGRYTYLSILHRTN